MRTLRRFYTGIKKEYYLMRASECLFEAGKNLGTDYYNIWMEQYRKYVDKAISLF